MKKYYLYQTFPTSDKDDTFIDCFDSDQEVTKYIYQYQKEHGNCPYTREWEYNGDIFVDYGNWSSFFRITQKEE